MNREAESLVNYYHVSSIIGGVEVWHVDQCNFAWIITGMDLPTEFQKLHIHSFIALQVLR